MRRGLFRTANFRVTRARQGCFITNSKDRDPALFAVIARGPLDHKLAEFVFNLFLVYKTDRVGGSIAVHNSSDKIALAILLRSSPALI